jgi:hypothetical protein
MLRPGGDPRNTASVCYANAMATTLDARGIRLFDYPKLFAEPLRDAIKAHATRVAADEGIEVEYIKRPKNYRKEDRIREILAERGTHPGLVHIFSVMGGFARPIVRGTTRQLASRICVRTHGTRVRHYLGPASMKMYDKHGYILRVETTTNDVSFFRHHRMVEQRDGQRVMKLADLKKSIYSLFPDLASVSRAANDGYIQFLSAIDDPTPGLRALSRISDSVEEREHRYRGFNLFDDDDQTLFEVLCRGEFFIQGFRNRSLREHLGRFRSSHVSRLLKRLRLHGIVKKVGQTYKYYLTELGRHVARRRTYSQAPLPRAGARPRWSHSLRAEILAFVQSIRRRTDYPDFRPFGPTLLFSDACAGECQARPG